MRSVLQGLGVLWLLIAGTLLAAATSRLLGDIERGVKELPLALRYFTSNTLPLVVGSAMFLAAGAQLVRARPSGQAFAIASLLAAASHLAFSASLNGYALTNVARAIGVQVRVPANVDFGIACGLIAAATIIANTRQLAPDLRQVRVATAGRISPLAARLAHLPLAAGVACVLAEFQGFRLVLDSVRYVPTRTPVVTLVLWYGQTLAVGLVLIAGARIMLDDPRRGLMWLTNGVVLAVFGGVCTLIHRASGQSTANASFGAAGAGYYLIDIAWYIGAAFAVQWVMVRLAAQRGRRICFGAAAPRDSVTSRTR